jgi:Ankyrin repeats (3 copies)/Ankyrin repeats (many copies)
VIVEPPSFGASQPQSNQAAKPAQRQQRQQQRKPAQNQQAAAVAPKSTAAKRRVRKRKNKRAKDEDDAELAALLRDLAEIDARKKQEKAGEKPIVNKHEKPIVKKQEKPIVNKDEKPIVNKDEKSIVNKDEKPIVNKDEKPIVNKDEKSIVNKDEKSIVNKQEKPIVNKDEKPIVNKHEKPIVNKDEKPIVNKHEKPIVNKQEKPIAKAASSSSMTPRDFGSNALQVAAAAGDLEGVKKALGDGVSPLAQNVAGWCALHQAAAWGHADVMVAMLASLPDDADVDVRNQQDKSALHLASFCGRGDVVRALLDAGANASAIDASKNYVLHYAAQSNCLRSVKVLIDAGADVHSRDGLGGTPFSRAADVDVRRLLDPHARSSSPSSSSSSSTPVVVAAAASSPSSSKKIVDDEEPLEGDSEPTVKVAGQEFVWVRPTPPTVTIDKEEFVWVRPDVKTVEVSDESFVLVDSQKFGIAASSGPVYYSKTHRGGHQVAETSMWPLNVLLYYSTLKRPILPVQQNYDAAKKEDEKVVAKNAASRQRGVAMTSMWPLNVLLYYSTMKRPRLPPPPTTTTTMTTKAANDARESRAPPTVELKPSRSLTDGAPPAHEIVSKARTREERMRQRSLTRGRTERLLLPSGRSVKQLRRSKSSLLLEPAQAYEQERQKMIDAGVDVDQWTRSEAAQQYLNSVAGPGAMLAGLMSGVVVGGGKDPLAALKARRQAREAAEASGAASSSAAEKAPAAPVGDPLAALRARKAAKEAGQAVDTTPPPGAPQQVFAPPKDPLAALRARKAAREAQAGREAQASTDAAAKEEVEEPAKPDPLAALRARKAAAKPPPGAVPMFPVGGVALPGAAPAKDPLAALRARKAQALPAKQAATNEKPKEATEEVPQRPAWMSRLKKTGPPPPPAKPSADDSQEPAKPEWMIARDKMLKK